MKKLIFMLFLFIGIAAQAQSKKVIDKPTIVEASCGECQFGMKGKSCDLAVRIDGKSYFVDGTKIDQHGDAHAEDGFCNAIRKASVTGEIVGNRFKATSFTLIEDKK
ncbi:DUF6370 family protein [Flavobacterium reichenbachii]|uniref:Glutaminyl-tRNA synthetase n=1 Tax=Flavobacterium reichenbachii TaxID=362418 RepID=A0A085ZQN0_9FLAO|nr:DUF6370 family protein [Flavobacterium reichenbachii]KFF06744.1 glutaminyl-tRNA synthetase [Flavobacterium reichenbachii]OXB18652.1 hypothetical protein B0A68_01140 [Flavobacterium reichenbachii]